MIVSTLPMGLDSLKPNKPMKTSGIDQTSIDLWQIFLRIDRHAVDPHLVMNVASSAPARGADITQNLSPFDLIPYFDVDAGAMPISRAVAISMFDGDQTSITRFPTRVSHDPVGRRADGRVDLIGDIHPHMPSRLAGERRSPFTETGSDPAFDGPYGRGRGKDGMLFVQIHADLFKGGLLFGRLLVGQFQARAHFMHELIVLFLKKLGESRRVFLGGT